MAEKGIIVSDAASGESVACRDAIQNDDDSNARIIQLVDVAPRPVTYQKTTALRSGISASDNYLIEPLPSGISSNLLTVSDAQSVVVWGIVAQPSYGNLSFLATVTPIIVSDDSTPVPVTLLPPFDLKPVFPKKTANSSSVTTDILAFASATYPTIAISFPTMGANRIGFHVNIYGNSDETTSVSLFAAVSSMAGRNSAIDSDILSGTWGTYYPNSAGGEG